MPNSPNWSNRSDWNITRRRKISNQVGGPLILSRRVMFKSQRLLRFRGLGMLISHTTVKISIRIVKNAVTKLESRLEWFLTTSCTKAVKILQVKVSWGCQPTATIYRSLLHINKFKSNITSQWNSFEVNKSLLSVFLQEPTNNSVKVLIVWNRFEAMTHWPIHAVHLLTVFTWKPKGDDVA